MYKTVILRMLSRFATDFVINVNISNSNSKVQLYLLPQVLTEIKTVNIITLQNVKLQEDF